MFTAHQKSILLLLEQLMEAKDVFFNEPDRGGANWLVPKEFSWNASPINSVARFLMRCHYLQEDGLYST